MILQCPEEDKLKQSEAIWSQINVTDLTLISNEFLATDNSREFFNLSMPEQVTIKAQVVKLPESSRADTRQCSSWPLYQLEIQYLFSHHRLPGFHHSYTIIGVR